MSNKQLIKTTLMPDQPTNNITYSKPCHYLLNHHITGSNFQQNIQKQFPVYSKRRKQFPTYTKSSKPSQVLHHFLNHVQQTTKTILKSSKPSNTLHIQIKPCQSDFSTTNTATKGFIPYNKAMSF